MPKHLEREIDNLKKMFLQLCALVEENVHLSIKSLNEVDITLAKNVIDNDDEIDKLEIEIEEECLKILALYKPVASDLRYIVAILRINNELERIGDLAVNIAKKIKLMPLRAKMTSELLPEMIEKVLLMLKISIDSFVKLDVHLARKIPKLDTEVDQYKRDMRIKMVQEIKANPEKVDTYIGVMANTRHLERMADLATNIAEDVIYMVEGEIVRHSD